MYHQTILGELINGVLVCNEKDALARLSKYTLVAIQNIQVLLEMIGRLHGQKSRWVVVLILEVLKAVSRLKILTSNSGEPLKLATKEDIPIKGNQIFSETIELYRKTGRGVSGNRHGRFTTQYSNNNKKDMVISLRSVLAELVHIFRPVLYVVMIMKKGHSSWVSFLTSLLLDVTSFFLHSFKLALPKRVKDEIDRRAMFMVLYLFRSPLFEKIVQKPLIKLLSILKNLPLFGIIFANLLQLLISLQKHYFYTSPL